MTFPIEILLAVAGAAGQAPGTPPIVIRAESRLVLVDAVVTDRHGNYVSDLTGKDFRVWDDNREQKVQGVTFEAQRAAEAGAPSYLVLFFDNATLDPNAQRRARVQAAEFLGANTSPNQLTAVVNYGAGLEITQNFTADTERLKRVVADARTSVARPQNQEQARQTRGGTTISPGSSPLVDYGSTSMLLALRSLAANLAAVPGRKSIVLFTSDVPLTPEVAPPLASAISLCNRANIAVYPTDVAGLTLNKGPGSQAGPADTIDPNNAHTQVLRQMGAGGVELSSPDRQILDQLAAKTGGVVFIGSNDLRSGLQKIGNELTRYYLIGFAPPDSPEGSCHALRVKVERAGIAVRARASYCNVRAVDLLAGKPVERTLVDLLAGDRPGTVAASIRLPFFCVEANTAQVHAAMEIAAESFHFDKVKGKFHAEANVMGLAYRPDGSVGVRFSDTVKLDFATQKELDDFHRQPFRYEKQFLAAPGSYTLKVVFSTGGESFARLDLPLEIPPWDGRQFMLSGVVLSRELRPAAELGSEQDAELLEGRTPLIFGDLRIVPSGSNRFRKNDAAAAYVEVYGAAAGAVEIRTRMVDRKTGETRSTGLSHLETAGATMLPVGLKLNLSDLAPGMYRFEVEAVDSGGRSMMRSAEFQVE